MSDTDKPFRMRTFDLATENERYLYVECVNDKGRIAELEEELNRYRHGYRGGCYACEQVAQLNIKLEAELIIARRIIKNNGALCIEDRAYVTDLTGIE